MSAPGDQPSSAKAIRVVPYSPPRPRQSEDSQRSSGTATGTARDDGPDDEDGRNNATSELTTTGGERGRRRREREHGPPLSLAKRQEGGSVSGWGDSATFRGSSTSEFTDPRTGLSPSMIPASRRPPSRGRLSTASYTTNSSQPSRQSMSSRSSHVSDTESEAPSTTSTQRRPQSRRPNFVAVLNDDKKTFSLVPQRPKAPESQEDASQDPPRSESALSSEYGGGPSYRSSQLHSFPTTPRASQASSHEGYSSYASSHYERPSSSLTGNIQDRSLTPGTPTSAAPSSPGLTITQDSVPEPSSPSPSPWNFRMVGGLRRVPNLSLDSEGKHAANTNASSSDTLTPQPAVTDSDAPGYDENPVADNPVDTRSIEQEQTSIHSSPHSSGSDTTNYRVYRDASQAPSESEPRATSEEQEERASDESSVDPFLRPQPSFATGHTGSTEFDNSNYRVYGHSDSEGSEGSEEDHQDSPTTGPSARALRTPRIPQLEPQSSIASLESGVSETSDNTNYRVYGPGSPALEPVPEFSPLQSTRELRPANSFLSAASTFPENDNYVVYGRNSPAALSSVESFTPPSPSGSYAPLIRPSTAQSLPVQDEETEEAGPSGTANADPNYTVHGDPTPEPSREASPATSESGGTVVRHISGPGYSQESLVISPLRPRRSQDGFGYFRARSRSTSKEDLKTKKSLKSVKSSISSIINEDAAESFFAGQAYLDGPPGEYEKFNIPPVAGPSERQRQLEEQQERERQQRESSAWEGEGASGSQGPMALPATPHQWSSQLSTVLSESEPDSNATHSSLRSVSLPGSPGGYGSQGSSHERRNSRGWSTHSRQMLSISSSLAADLEANSRSRSDSSPSQPGSIERPSPSHRYQGQVRDHDEDGDGLADLQVVTPRPSRGRLSDMFTQGNSSDRNLHSSASTRSFNNGIPTWAKLYYGSGEHRFMRSTSISSMSDLSSRPGSVQHSNSPTSDQFPMGLWNARRRPQEAHSGLRRSVTGSVDIPHGSDDDHVHDVGFRRSIRRMTSSVWSPHLRRDVRAQNRYTIWDAPSVAWSADSGMFGRRNLQVVLFVMGFIFPFSWMIGAILPLPTPSPLAMVQRDSSYSDLGVRTSSNEFERHIESVDELRFENAKWWRMLNRGMSVIGLLIIGAVVGLSIAAVKQGWATRS